MSKQFASTTDAAEQIPEVVELGSGVYGYCSSHDPNCGFIVGDESVLAIDARATPKLARGMLDAIADVTDKPVSHLFLTHYHAVRVLGASAVPASLTFCSNDTLKLIRERGQADMDSEIGRFPRLFDGVDEIPGLTWPNATFTGSFDMHMGGKRLEFRQLGRAHTAGDTVCHIPDLGIVFAGDIVENRCGVYMGDGYLGDWLQTLEALRSLDAEHMVPGRGAPMRSRHEISDAIDATKDFIASILDAVGHGLRQGYGLKGCYETAREKCDPRFGDWPIYEHVLAFNTARAYDELRGLEHPAIWTDARDQALWAEIHS